LAELSDMGILWVRAWACAGRRARGRSAVVQVQMQMQMRRASTAREVPPDPVSGSAGA